MYVCHVRMYMSCMYVSRQEQKPDIWVQHFFDTPLKCGESPLSIPLCGKIR